MGVDLPEGTTLHRTYAGRLQKQAGAWTWYAVGPNGEDLNFGSYCTVGELLRAPRLLVTYPDRELGRSVEPCEKA